MKRKRTLEKHLDRMESRRDPRAYIFYGTLAVAVLGIVAIVIIAIAQGGK